MRVCACHPSFTRSFFYFFSASRKFVGETKNRTIMFPLVAISRRKSYTVYFQKKKKRKKRSRTIIKYFQRGRKITRGGARPLNFTWKLVIRNELFQLYLIIKENSWTESIGGMFPAFFNHDILAHRLIRSSVWSGFSDSRLVSVFFRRTRAIMTIITRGNAGLLFINGLNGISGLSKTGLTFEP